MATMSDGSSEKRQDELSLSMKLAFPNELDDFIGKVVREGAYLEDVLRECVGILGGLANDVDVLLMGQSWDWLHSMAVGFQKEPVYATRRCNDEALPEIGKVLSEADVVWKRRNAVVHASWIVCPSLLGGTCEIAESNGGEVRDDEYHVLRSMRRKSEREVKHRYIEELEELVQDFERVRQDLLDGLKMFNPNAFR
jgi:hypothetical protein